MADLLIKKYYNEGLSYLNERADADIKKTARAILPLPLPIRTANRL